MNILNDLLSTVTAEGTVRHLTVGSQFTVSVVDCLGGMACGVATTVPCGFFDGAPPVREAGRLEGRRASELAALVDSPSPVEVSIGMATLNALLSHQNLEGLSRSGVTKWDTNGLEWLQQSGKGRKVVVVGHFPFTERLRASVGELAVLEKVPRDGDLPEDRAGEVIPEADLVALTSMTLVNRTFEGLMRLVRPQTSVIVIGPGTPFSSVLYQRGVSILAGAVVDRVEPLLVAARQGASFRQAREMGLRFVTIGRDERQAAGSVPGDQSAR